MAHYKETFKTRKLTRPAYTGRPAKAVVGEVEISGLQLQAFTTATRAVLLFLLASAVSQHMDSPTAYGSSRHVFHSYVELVDTPVDGQSVFP
ncbi:hypothetical protein M8818_007647 [Zalaria obscura]|uniref:Uncharacterized protein n=1 Tax=Zalaria obscura TaxID=2024903 RepID=A0ACC3S2F1_9PEZI